MVRSPTMRPLAYASSADSTRPALAPTQPGSVGLRHLVSAVLARPRDAASASAHRGGAQLADENAGSLDRVRCFGKKRPEEMKRMGVHGEQLEPDVDSLLAGAASALASAS